MLIGDKGESGGRRWEVVGFAPEPFSTSRKVSPRSVAGCSQIPQFGIFYQSQGQTLGGQIYGFRSFDQSQGQTLGGVQIP